MNILSKLSIRNLKLNKKRTISTIIGIILSVALICAVTTMGMSFRESLIQNDIKKTGYFHIKIEDVNSDNIRTFKNNRNVKEVKEISECGYGIIKGSKNEYKPYLKLYSMNKNVFSDLKFELEEGRFPNNQNELVISKHLINNGKVNLKVGDKIKLDTGNRFTTDDFKLHSQNIYLEGKEKLVDKKSHEFTIVGIIKRPDYIFESHSDPGYTAITTNVEEENKQAFIVLKNPFKYKETIPEILGVNSYKDIFEEASNTKLKFNKFELNQDLLYWESFAFSDSTIQMLTGAISVVIVIIIFTSVFCIRNSFAIATTEKTKIYSMLASVGTTKKQIKRNVILEGMLLGVIGIPLGILAGIFAVYVLIHIVNILIGEALFGTGSRLVFKVSYISIFISIILGIITIYLSAKSSAIRASKISPIEGLRNSQDIILNNKTLKTPKIISKVFKTGGVLAYKNLKRNKKKYRTTVISIAVSIFIFITMNVFITNMFEASSEYYKDLDYNIKVTGKLTEKQIEDIINLDKVKSSGIAYFIIRTNGELLGISDMARVLLKDNVILTEGKYVSQEIIAIDDVSFKKYVTENNLDYNKVKDKAILADYKTIYLEKEDKYVEKRIYNYEKGDTLDLGYGYKFEIGGVLKENPSALKDIEYTNGLIVINKEHFKDFKYELDTIAINTDSPEELEKEIKKVQAENLNVYNLDKIKKEQNGMNLVINIFLYGFITVITLIGVTNIFNTITSNMELRQKEFAMLKSIGMTKKEFNRMINLETIFYCTKAWLYGTTLGLIGTIVMYKVTSVKIDKGIYIPYIPIIISAIFVLIFVYIIMKYSISKINKQNTIETIRKENI